MFSSLRRLLMSFRDLATTTMAYRRAVGLGGLLRRMFYPLMGRRMWLETVREAQAAHPLYLRVPTSDMPTFGQVFVQREYEFRCPRQPRVIVDAGANIGLAAIYFANRFPQARIVAIEPETSNFQLLKKNVAAYPQITAVQAAVWNVDTEIDVFDSGMGNWGFVVEAPEEASKRGHRKLDNNKVEALSIPTIMERHGLERIDILKIDIEGAEREVFADTSAWIGRVDAVIAELHESLKPGATRNFYRGTEGFDVEWRQGENYYVARQGVIER